MANAVASPPDAATLAELSNQGADGQALADSLTAKHKALQERLYPQPSARDIDTFYRRSKQIAMNWRLGAIAERKRRYQKDLLPEKWQQNLQDGRRFYSRLTHNEINRVVGAQMGNGPKVLILPSADTQKERDRAAKESRWSQNIFTAVERVSTKPIRRRFVDCQNEIGYAGYEVYLTGAYDGLDTQPHLIEDPSSPGQFRMETNREVLGRTDMSMKRAKAPFGIRYIDGLTLYAEEDDEGVCRAAIVERKPFRQVFESMLKNNGIDIGNYSDYEDENGVEAPPNTPLMGDAGYPEDTNDMPGVQVVETIRFYDRRWLVYLVAGKVVQCEEHGIPILPVFPGYGLVTGSPNMENMAEGICWGMASMELAVNDMLTLAMDVQFTYSRPKLVIVTPMDGDIMRSEEGPDAGKPVTLDFSKPGVQQLNPGQTVANVLEGFQPYLQLPLLSTIMNLWQRSGLNPIAQGESPGAAPAGYTVSTLTGSAYSVYEDIVENEAVTTGRVIDCIRLMVRDTIKDATPLAVPMQNGVKGTEWLSLSPDEVSETPAIVTIDPTSAANRMAKRQSLQQGAKEGFIARRRVQVEGFDIEDPEAEDDQIVIDQGVQQLSAWAIQNALQKVQTLTAPAPPPGMGAPGPGGPQDPSAMPAPTAPPTVGAAMANASKGGAFQTQPGPAAMPASEANAGQGGGYIPPNLRQ